MRRTQNDLKCKYIQAINIIFVLFPDAGKQIENFLYVSFRLGTDGLVKHSIRNKKAINFSSFTCNIISFLLEAFACMYQACTTNKHTMSYAMHFPLRIEV